MLDQKDHLLLKLLQDNSRISASEAGEKLELSVPAASERIKKLLDGGYIKKFTAQLDSKKLGLDLTAFISVDSSSSSHYEDIIVQSKKNNSVLECHSVTGEGSHLLKICVQNSSKLESLLKEIQGWPGVVRTHTWVVLSTFKESIKLNIEMKD